jgi:hypothetical protein
MKTKLLRPTAAPLPEEQEEAAEPQEKRAAAATGPPERQAPVAVAERAEPAVRVARPVRLEREAWPAVRERAGPEAWLAMRERLEALAREAEVVSTEDLPMVGRVEPLVVSPTPVRRM